MTPAQAATELLRKMPLPVSIAQLKEYGIDVSESGAQVVSREILSLNLYWILAAIDSHIPSKYQTAISDLLLRSIKTGWWESGQLGGGTWEDYLSEFSERRALYGRLVDWEGKSHMAVSAEAATLIEDQNIVSSEDRTKLLVLLIDYAPAEEYGSLLDEVG